MVSCSTGSKEAIAAGATLTRSQETVGTDICRRVDRMACLLLLVARYLKGSAGEVLLSDCVHILVRDDNKSIRDSFAKSLHKA